MFYSFVHLLIVYDLSVCYLTRTDNLFICCLEFYFYTLTKFCFVSRTSQPLNYANLYTDLYRPLILSPSLSPPLFLPQAAIPKNPCNLVALREAFEAVRTCSTIFTTIFLIVRLVIPGITDLRSYSLIRCVFCLVLLHATCSIKYRHLLLIPLNLPKSHQYLPMPFSPHLRL